ncbi:mitogen-activated protein kinase kinase [Metschnikowia aff. pulcherrima]|uniref:Mitogen-activated protein kinase kinase n=1 Tax=Metschnikowia aff. pulcherrima TaxID=2163413 RepID=A0A4P6XXQ3_9ASCO|nr:mitogen-activated protein kinase kinase [Metschnikowia aff. pulcherrima]
MSEQSPMFHIPPPRRHPQNQKLLLSIPQPLLHGQSENLGKFASDLDASALNAPVPLPYMPQPAQKPLRRKPVPLDFTKIDGSHSHAPGIENPTENGDGIAEIEAKTEKLKISLDLAKEAPSVACLDDVTPEEWNCLANSNLITELSKLGEGNGGSVAKCVLKRGSPVFALKLINTDPNPDVQKQIIRELQYNRLCHSPNIVKYYGTFMVEKQLMIGIAMEYMGGGTLDAIYKRVLELDPTNRVSEKVLGKIAESVLKGLSYLHEQKIIHRDIKPSNILLDTKGNVKICDFGVSGDVVNSLATTFVGTQYYMAPERIMGQPYTVSCDVWLLGVTLLEVAQGRFPFVAQNLAPLGPIELLLLILECEPQLEDNLQEQIRWLDSFRNFLGYCLKKTASDRPPPLQILRHPWCVGQLRYSVNMEKFVRKVWGA